MALSLDVEVGQSIKVGDAKITFVHKTGRKARILIDADRDVPIDFNHRDSSSKPSASGDHTEKR